MMLSYLQVLQKKNSSGIGFGTGPEGSAQTDMMNNQAFPMNIVVRRATVCRKREKINHTLVCIRMCQFGSQETYYLIACQRKNESTDNSNSNIIINNNNNSVIQ